MILSVFTRHSSICKFKRDRLCRRCSCPKWVGGQIDKEYFRASASTRIWDEAELYRDKLEEALSKGLPPFGPEPDSTAAPIQPASPSPLAALPAPAQPSTETPAELQPPACAPHSPTGEILRPVREKARVTVQQAVEAYMKDARSRGLQPDTISKLERIFEKQFLPWTRAEGLEYLDQLDHDALLSYRSTWTEGMVVKAKKQDRIIGFF